MARAPDDRVAKAKELYDKGTKLIEIAKQLDIPEGTVRSWKNRYEWDCNVAKNKCNVAKEKKQKKKSKEKPVAEEVESVLENTELTDKQQLFCALYTKCFNATKAYHKAYGCSYETALTNGPALLGNTRIKNEIMKLKRNKMNREMLDETDIFQKYMDIAFADITDYLEFGREQIQVMSMYGPVEVEDPKTGEKKPLMKTVNTVRFKESTQVDGTIISEVKQGKDGASIKLADRMKALQWLTDHMDLATDEQKARTDLMRQKVKENEDGKKDAINKLDEILKGIKQNAETE